MAQLFLQNSYYITRSKIPPYPQPTPVPPAILFNATYFSQRD